MHTNSPHDGAVYTGHLVADEQGREVGKVVDVIYDDDSALADPPMNRRPAWLVVDLGLLRGAHYMPVAGTDRTKDGTIVTPWGKAWVKSATRAAGDHILSPDQRTELATHYALGE